MTSAPMEGGQHRVHRQPPPQRVPAGEHTRLGVYHDVLRRLRDAGAAEACAPGFADRLWAHFHRFGVRYALDVNAERVEDVLVHMQLLDDRAKSSETENRPAFSVRVVQVPAPKIDATETDSAEPNPTEGGGDSATPRKLAISRLLFVKPAAGTSWIMAMVMPFSGYFSVSGIPARAKSCYRLSYMVSKFYGTRL